MCRERVPVHQRRLGTTGVGLLISTREKAGLRAGLTEAATRLDGIHLIFLITIVTSLLALASPYKLGPVHCPAEGRD